MSNKISNPILANRTNVCFTTELVNFDENGIGTIESEELYNDVLQIPGFCIASEQSTQPLDGENADNAPKDGENGDNTPKDGENAESIISTSEVDTNNQVDENATTGDNKKASTKSKK